MGVVFSMINKINDTEIKAPVEFAIEMREFRECNSDI